jgi:hypothetical protein
MSDDSNRAAVVERKVRRHRVSRAIDRYKAWLLPANGDWREIDAGRTLYRRWSSRSLRTYSPAPRLGDMFGREAAVHLLELLATVEKPTIGLRSL